VPLSIPSRRVGDLIGCQICRDLDPFHPLKAGRRLKCHQIGGAMRPLSIPSRRVGDLIGCQICRDLDPFHPLKAGRRRACGRRRLAGVGDFHPLKAGRRQFCQFSKDPLHVISIPSRRVGDGSGVAAALKIAMISIPSRRVGDRHKKSHDGKRRHHFHPLKAGRRRIS